MKNKLNWLAWHSVIFIGIVSCLKLIHEPDLWWQIRTGQWIIDNGEVPKEDIFSFTFMSEPWINVKWFAEVLMATVNDIFGVEWLILLQIGCITTILFFCYKLSNAVLLKYSSIKSTVPKIGIMLTGLLLVFTINYRMNSRPEMFSHLLVIVFLYYLFKYSRTKSNWLFIIIPLQIIWTNTHEAYGMGIVLILIFLVAHWTESIFFKQDKPWRYTLIGIIAILSSGINPNGVKMIAHPFNIFGQLSANKFTTELHGFKDDNFWYHQAYVFLLVFIICLLFLTRTVVKKSFSIKNIVNTIGLPYVLIMLAFFYLSLTAFRNIPFFMIVCTPLLANYIDAKFKTQKKQIYYGILAISFVFYCSLASNQFYSKLLPREHFGIGLNSESTPIGAAKFLKAHKIEGKGFVDYLSSSYFLYELQPEYKSFIDLRDLDVFNAEFFQNTFRLYRAPTSLLTSGQTLWEYYKALDQFNYIVLLNSFDFEGLNKHLVNTDGEFELVYADHLNSVYVRTNEANQPLIAKYGFSEGSRDVYHPLVAHKNAVRNASITKVLWPFKVVDTKESFLTTRGWYYHYIGHKEPKLKGEK